MEIDQEQLQTLKLWWHRYGAPILFGGAIGISLLLGWTFWQQYKAKEANAASALYETMVRKLKTGEEGEGSNLANELITRYGSTTYAYYAELFLAKIFLDRGDLVAAKTHMERSIERAPYKLYRELSTLRLAHVLYGMADYEAALTQLGTLSATTGFGAQADELRGDIFAAQGDRQSARESYQAALSKNGTRVQSEFLERKWQNVAP